MSQTQVHSFSIPIDGFGAGDGRTFRAPLAHAEARGRDRSLRAGFSSTLIIRLTIKLQGGE